MTQFRPYVSMVDTKITDLTRFQLRFHTFIACWWPCEGNYVGLLFSLLVSTISNIIFGDNTVSGVPENHTLGLDTNIMNLLLFCRTLHKFNV